MKDQRIGTEVGMLGNLIKRQMALMTAGSDVDCITGMQAMILHYLIHAEPQGAHFQKDVEAEFSIRRSTATGILQLMERNGLLIREQTEYDARLKRLVLTDKARALHALICDGLERTELLMQQGISEQELAVWFAVCGKIHSNLEEYQRNISKETEHDKTTGKMRAGV